MNEPLQLLQKYWGHNTFRKPQQEIITSLLAGNDTLALLPTGGGKSICFQIPMLCTDGIGLVISPLIALMEDQVQQLKEKNIKAIALTGTNSVDEISELLDNCLYGNYKFLYLSPERLQQQWILERLVQLPINFIAVDEAHCISQWGHDFRPAYLQIHTLRDYLSNIPIIALTASATQKIQQDIINQLQLRSPKVFKKSFHRQEISYITHKVDAIDNTLYQVFSKSKEPGIIYVRNRRKTIEIAKNLNQYGIRAEAFHGGLTYRDKKNILQSWLSDENQVIVATNAFGMGIDKPNVRHVIHIQIPENIESYYQEAGRAGRDGNDSKAILLYNDRILLEFEQIFINNKLDPDFLKLVFKKFINDNQIAYGEGYGEEYYLNFAQFCEKHQLPFSRTYSALQFLDRQGVITLKKEFHFKTYIHFLWDNEQIINYFKSKPIEERLFLYIIHNYRGTSEIETAINIKEISKKTMYSETIILNLFNDWQKQGICTFKNTDNDTKIILNEIREDDITINRTIKYLKQNNSIKEKQFEAMMKYVITEDICKSQLLLNYFEEKSEPCGKCSVCKKRNKKPNESTDWDKIILKNIPFDGISIEQLADNLNINHTTLFPYLEQLQDKKQINIQHHIIKKNI